MSGNSIENTIICIDNSDYMRNEDIRPNRFVAEKDAINMICHHILTSRPENSVGIVTLGDTPQVIQSKTNNEINLMRKLYAIEMKGEIDLTVAIKISILALKYDSAKNRRQRIIAFVGSPFKEDQEKLDTLVNKLNKLNISVDIIGFGSENQTKSEILNCFVRKLKNSYYMTIPNDRIMNNVLAESPILSNSGTVSLVNENMDPELSLAMKMSVDQLQEDMKKAIDESTKTSQAGVNVLSSPSNEDIQKAIEMSLELRKKSNTFVKGSKSQKIQSSPNSHSKGMTEEEQLALSLQMSLLSQKHSLREKKEGKEKSKRKANHKKSKNGCKKNEPKK